MVEPDPREINSRAIRVLEPDDAVVVREERVSIFLMIVEHPQATIQKQLLFCLQRHLRRLSLCKLAYTQHIHLKTHRNNINQNTFNHHVLALAKDCQRRIPISREVKVEKQVEVTEVDDSDEVEIVENPVRKVRHTEEGMALPRWGWH